MNIEERLEKVEKELSVLLDLSDLQNTVSPRPKEIRANSFIVVDENGKTRAALTMIEDRVGLVAFDQNGQARIRLAVRKEGPWLRLQDENGNVIWKAP